jgi:hypothetical protein
MTHGARLADARMPLRAPAPWTLASNDGAAPNFKELYDNTPRRHTGVDDMPKITGYDMIATHKSALRALAAKRSDKIVETCATESDVFAAHTADG